MRDIEVYGEIGEGWDPDTDMTAKRFSDLLREADGDDVTVHINSGGGSVFDANTMAELLRSYKGRTVARIEGLAASAASYFALTADEVQMGAHAILMVHNPSTVAYGQADELRKTADMLDKVRGTIVGQYAAKVGGRLTGDELEAMVDAETWMSADEALEMGFVDSVFDAEPVAACVSPRLLASFKNVPEDAFWHEGDPLPEPPVPVPGGVLPAAGEPGGTIPGSAPEGDVEPGAGETGSGAEPACVCVNGHFLYA